ncbi:MAG: sel1 repeat family protein [Pontiellaceae bacterium]|nr:sel1 repeat family protein [Pontiellaceae bacterium]MBN2783622.1 sel1 repeat family protein [Pontiellaceae bacterium]
MLRHLLAALALLLSVIAGHATELEALVHQAESGDPAAQFELGKRYFDGKEVEQDDVLAAAWYRKAAEQDYGPAVVAMVYCCEEGTGVEEDLDAATAWYEKALDLGYDRHLEKQEEPEKLSDYTALFAENDARLRTLDPNNPSCTNYVEWIETAIKSLDELGRRSEIDPWIEELAALGTNNWKLLHAVAMGFDKRTEDLWWDAPATRFREFTLFDRAYRLMIKNPPPLGNGHPAGRCSPSFPQDFRVL